MEIREKQIGVFLDELARGEPTPGCGCVSGLCGALGTALVSMVANLTVGRAAYAGVDEKMRKIQERARALLEIFPKLAKDDMVVFAEYLAAIRMPAETEEERRVRDAALSVRSKLIVSVPVEIVKQSVALAAIALDVQKNGNANAVMDAAAAVQLACVTAGISANNARFNLRFTQDERFASSVLVRLNTAMQDIEGIVAASGENLAGIVRR